MSEHSSSSDEEVDFVLYADRPEWQDIVPVTQEEGGKPVVSIMYSPEYSTTMDYFRAIAAKGELSERAIALTTDCIGMNAANYTVWHYRRKCLKHLSCNVADELKFVEKLATKHPKNYQIWFHRRAVVELTKHTDEEDRFVRKALMIDSKNYHAWGHRQWYAEYAQVLDTELAFVEDMLQADIRNNSAWNYRHFVVTKTTGFDAPGIREREIEFTLTKIRRAPNNESPWNYLRGIMLGNVPYSQHPNIMTALEEMRKQGVPSPFIEEQTLLIYMQELSNGASSRRADCIALLEALATKYDTIRSNYWNYKLDTLKEKYPAMSA